MLKYLKGTYNIMNFHITSALPEHFESFANLMIKSWHNAYSGIIPQEFLDNKATMEKYIPRVKAILSCYSDNNFVAILDDEIIVAFSVSKLRENAQLNDDELIAIYLLPDYLGKGYGKQMIEYSISTLKKKSFSNMYI